MFSTARASASRAAPTAAPTAVTAPCPPFQDPWTTTVRTPLWCRTAAGTGRPPRSRRATSMRRSTSMRWRCRSGPASCRSTRTACPRTSKSSSGACPRCVQSATCGSICTALVPRTSRRSCSCGGRSSPRAWRTSSSTATTTRCLRRPSSTTRQHRPCRAVASCPWRRRASSWCASRSRSVASTAGATSTAPTWLASCWAPRASACKW
mmetsp:Transcript_20777/g.65564  ORF Transcript_20777/g.65564 Transcript_20777/m.65564 type:complete len:208 (-) Transcript_20777:2497-3120(-)